MDITMSKEDKIVIRDNEGLYQTHTFGMTLTDHDVPEEAIKLRTLQLQKELKLYLLNEEVAEGVKTLEQAKLELRPYIAALEKVLGTKNGNLEAKVEN